MLPWVMLVLLPERLFMNLFLTQNDYLSCVIHAGSRDAYIEAIELISMGVFEHIIAITVEQSLLHTLKVVCNGGLAK